MGLPTVCSEKALCMGVRKTTVSFVSNELDLNLISATNDGRLKNHLIFLCKLSP